MVPDATPPSRQSELTGGCSSKGRLTFDTGLLRQPAAFRAEVIIHELLHLKVPNHGKLFKALLKTWLSQIDEPAGIESLKGMERE